MIDMSDHIDMARKTSDGDLLSESQRILGKKRWAGTTRRERQEAMSQLASRVKGGTATARAESAWKTRWARQGRKAGQSPEDIAIEHGHKVTASEVRQIWAADDAKKQAKKQASRKS